MSDRLKEIDRDDANHDASQANWRNGATVAQGNTITFAFWPGMKPPAAEEKDTVKTRALQELSDFAAGEKPMRESDLKLHESLKRRSTNIKLTIVTIDPDSKTKSFSGPLRQLDNFLPKSRERFLADAVSHLKTLMPKEDEFGDMYGLCHALVRARNAAGGTLGLANDTILAQISADKTSPAGKALRSAEGTSTSPQKDGQPIFYDKRERDRPSR